ncbi:MAG: hypothetical protein COA42_03015 [Alteromonadaceae bacterium]|nr:MAG: hypothetical protein COA42_03015 [Alteromonadaceae bacterium]
MNDLDLKCDQLSIGIEELFVFPACLDWYQKARGLMSGNNMITYNFSNCRHIDSSALGVLFALTRTRSPGAPRAEFINVDPGVLKIMCLYKLDKFYTIN